MSRAFIADTVFEKNFIRKSAKGYKALHIDEDVEIASNVKLISDGDELRLVPDLEEYGEDEEQSYVILCKEFGLANGHTVDSSIVSVIFLDNEYMLMTLHSGAVAINIDGKVLLPAIGEVEKQGGVNNIKWVNQSDLKTYAKYCDTIGLFFDDLELYFEMSGYVNQYDLSSFKIKILREHCKDLSCGAYMAYLDKLQQEEQQKKVEEIKKAYTKPIYEKSNSEMELEFDEEEDDDEYDNDGYIDEDDEDEY